MNATHNGNGRGQTMRTINSSTYSNSTFGAMALALDAMFADYGSEMPVPTSVCHSASVGEFFVRCGEGLGSVLLEVNPKAKSVRRV